MGVSVSIATSMRVSVLLLFTAAVAGSSPGLFSLNEREAALQPCCRSFGQSHRFIGAALPLQQG